MVYHVLARKGPTGVAVRGIKPIAMNRPGMSGDSSSWKGWGHVRWFIEE
ncbi:transport acessory protein MmpS, partial [Mycobacterium tuberculosis]